MRPESGARAWRWFSLVFGVLLPAWLFWELWRDSERPSGLMLVTAFSALAPMPFLAWWLLIGASSRGRARVMGMVFTACGILAWIAALPVLLMLGSELARGRVDTEDLPSVVVWTLYVVTTLIVLFGNARLALRAAGPPSPPWSSRRRPA